MKIHPFKKQFAAVQKEALVGSELNVADTEAGAVSVDGVVACDKCSGQCIMPGSLHPTFRES